MGELSVSLLRLSYLLVLWLFVIAALATLRRDVYGTTITRRGSGRRPSAGSRRLNRVPPPAELAAAAGLAAAPAPPPVPTRPGAPTKLVVKTGPLKGATLPLTRSPVVIGRSSTANLVLDDEFASGRHAQIVPRLGGWTLEDLGSTNGTFVGRERITGPRELSAGESIKIGNTTLEVLR
ncbi:MAG: FHA domain-containing protein [Bifidobacteriaceae bacterium]|jgi:pSer/pThr/pTyr-binding forkhead associated (FHA) protein|nr:FHA domain-containing protein [Bifidobacteriaceae bacterium]